MRKSGQAKKRSGASAKESSRGSAYGGSQVLAHLNFSARAYDRILKAARTIADAAAAENILSDHISDAVQYRSLDRELWT